MAIVYSHQPGEHIVKERFSFDLEVREQVAVSGGSSGTTSVPAGKVEKVTVEVVVDMAAIARHLVDRVARAKSGKSRYMDGCVKVNRIGAKPVLLIKKPAAPPVGQYPT